MKVIEFLKTEQLNLRHQVVTIPDYLGCVCFLVGSFSRIDDPIVKLYGRDYLIEALKIMMDILGDDGFAYTDAGNHMTKHNQKHELMTHVDGNFLPFSKAKLDSKKALTIFLV